MDDYLYECVTCDASYTKSDYEKEEGMCKKCGSKIDRIRR